MPRQGKTGTDQGRTYYSGPALFSIYNIPSQAEEHEVKLAIARVYHAAIAQNRSQQSRNPEDDEDNRRLMSFRVNLEKMNDHSGRLKSSGTILLPCLAGCFKKYAAQHPIMVPFHPDWNDKTTIASQALRIGIPSPQQQQQRIHKWSQADVDHLASTPWVDPRQEKEHEERRQALEARCQITDIQFGFDHFEPARFHKPGSPPNIHQFCIEWSRAYGSTDTTAFLHFLDDIHTIQIQIGDYNSSEYLFIKLRYSTIRKIFVKEDSTIVFSLWSAPILEKGPLVPQPKHCERTRLSGLDEQHKRVLAMFSKQFRIAIFSEEEMDLFLLMADEVGLTIEDAHPSLDEHDGLGLLYNAKHRPGEKLVHLADHKIQEITRRLKTLAFPVAFQVAALLQNGLLNPMEIMSTIRPFVNNLLQREPKHKNEDIGELIFRISRAALSWTIEDRLNNRLKDQLEKLNDEFWKSKSELPKPLKAGWFRCYRATVTPTSIILSGPSQEQSNGIIRRYHYASECFLRVNLTDEERLQLRWDRGVDGETFVRERFGSILKTGIKVAGRHYDFLGYSNSGLKEHCVWFITPFDGPNNTRITAEAIRKGIGEFSKDLEYQPAKLGARLAQAFSTTVPSVDLKDEEIEVVDDIVPEGKAASYQFTDGYGYMSEDLADEIWRSINRGVKPLPSPAPTAYQVRIGGAKGVIGINPKLTGRKVRLHRSMVKFQSQDNGVHVALKFDHPLPLFLNRPLVAVLEHQGIKIGWFTRLQEKAIAAARNSLLSIDTKASDFLRTRYLGASYGFPYIMHHLAKNKITRVDLEQAPHPWLDFFVTSLNIAMVHSDRELKYRARILIPSGYSLVGVADVHGELEEGQVYICTQEKDEEPKYYPEGKPGTVYVTRSPSIHPGDVQKFWARHPHEDSIYAKRPMINCIVFSCKGKRPPANMMAGGDLDGDLFQIIPETPDFKPQVEKAAEYEPVKPLQLERRATIDDIADFVVEFVNSDRMGIIAIQHLIISDQSRQELHDPRCMELAELHSRAVDFQKSGVAVKLPELPKRRFHYTPDYQSKGVELDDQTKYYESPKALGVLYRKIKIREVPSIKPNDRPTPWVQHPIYHLLMRLKPDSIPDEGQSERGHVESVFNGYARELKGIRGIYTVHHLPLSEEEVFMGVILEQTSTRRREDMSQMLREVTGQLVDHVRTSLMGYSEDTLDLWYARSLEAARLAFSTEILNIPNQDLVKDRQEARCSFGMIALRSAFECKEVIDGRRPESRRSRFLENPLLQGTLSPSMDPISPASLMSGLSLSSPGSSVMPITPTTPLSPASPSIVLSPISSAGLSPFTPQIPVREELAPIKRAGPPRTWANSKLRR